MVEEKNQQKTLDGTCKHEPVEGIILPSSPPQLKCKHCGEPFTENISMRDLILETGAKLSNKGSAEDMVTIIHDGFEENKEKEN